MWWIFLLWDIDMTCDEKTFTTNLGHVCEIVFERVPSKDVYIFTPHGSFRGRSCPTGTISEQGSSYCTRTTFNLVYETVVAVESPVPWFVPTKWGMWRPQSDTVQYICRSGYRMNGHGSCESFYQRRKKQ